MKKVLALVLALIMVCTMAFAAASSVTTDLDTKGYSLLMYNNTDEYDFKTEAVKSFKKTVTEPVVIKDGDTTTTVYTLPYYTIVENNDSERILVAYANDFYPIKLVKNGKVVDYLTLTSAPITTSDVIDRIIPGKDEANCGDYLITGTDCAVIGEHVYPIAGENWSSATGFAYYNGKFYIIDADTDFSDSAYIVPHTFSTEKYKSTDGTVNAVYCTKCKTFIPVVKKVAAESADLYVEIDSGVAEGYYYLKSYTTATATTNPNTGANDVIGVAAALAVVALVSGAALSLKK